MKTDEKQIWLAVAAPKSDLGYTVAADLAELAAWENWAKRRGQRLLGQFTTRREANARVAAWLHPSPANQPAL